MGKVFLTASILTVIAMPAHACSCAYDNSLPEFVSKTQFIFSGKVSEAAERSWENFDSIQQSKFDVLKSYKGELSKSIILNHSINGAMCGVNFKKNQTGLFFASNGTINDEEVLYTGLCSRTSFTNEQVIAYIETGLDSSELDWNCIYDIGKAYDKQLETHLFELDNKACETVLSLYDQIYRK